MTTLLDTNVLSELLRAAPSAEVLAWFARQAPESLFVSAVTQAEMLMGARLMPDGRRMVQLQSALDAMFADDFADRNWPFDSRAAAAYAEVVATRRTAGRPISQFDAQIAAIAFCQQASLASRNTADFEGCGLVLVDPWAAR